MLAVVFLRLFRLGDTLMPYYFYRPFNLYIDSGYVPDLIHLLYHSLTVSQLVLYVPIAVVLLGALLWGYPKSCKLALRAFSVRRIRSVFWGLTALYRRCGSVSTFTASLPSAQAFRPRLVFRVLWRRLPLFSRSAILNAMDLPRFKWLVREFRPSRRRWPGWEKAMFTSSSSSHTERLSLTNTAHAREFAPTVQAFEAALTQDGFTACSRFLQSPTFGGASWLGFGTLESGEWLPDQLRYNFLLNSKVAPLADYFNQAGYRTISVMPGTTMPWPEGKYFEYTRTYYAKDLDYRGPPFAWSPMPDQYTLHFIYTREIAPRREPLFIRYMLTSSHAPFNTQPPYLQNWDEIGHGEIYRRIQPVTFTSDWPDLKEGVRAYETAIGYDFTVLQDYLRGFVKDGALIIILGDHQPVVQITGPGASRLVPIHVISRNPSPHRSLYPNGLYPRHDPQPCSFRKRHG